MKILSIDIGIIHFSFVGCVVDTTYKLFISNIYVCKLINITELPTECNDPKCDLYHDKLICDYMSHLFKKYGKYFEEADLILVERQPLTGITSVQDIILFKYRHKCKLICPNTFHNYYQIGDFNREQRKEFFVKYATPYLSKFKSFCFNIRKHDMADAFCIMYYFLKIKENEYNIKKYHDNITEKHKLI
jgi:hypothetical protein